MRTLHQTLHLQHHRHTGKLLHHHHTSYRGLAVVLALAGLLMAGLAATNRAAAETFGVSAVVNVPVPSTAPIIATPGVDAVVNQSSVLITGSCPLVTPQVVVAVRVDGTLAGTGACDPNNDFAIPVTLSGGDHQIVASSVTISGQAGPSSSPLSVMGTAKAAAPVISVVPDSASSFLGDDKTAVWSGTISAADASSLFVHIDWGDGTQRNSTVQPGAQRFTHTYAHLASHNILLAVSDVAGHVTSMQYATAAFTAAAPRSSAQALPFYGTRTVAGLYGLYLTAVCTVAIIWLEAKHSAKHAALGSMA